MAAGPITVNDVFRVVYFQTLFAQRLMNVFYLRCTVAPSGGVGYFSALESLANRLASDANHPVDNWLPIVGDELEFDDVRVQRVWPTNDMYAQAHMGLDGSHADPATQSNDAISIEKRTSVFGRHGIGRIQIGGVPASQISAGKFSGAYQSLVETFANNFIGDIGVAGGLGTYRFCLFNGDAPTADDDYFDMIVKPEVRTMHRRTLGLGI